MSEFRDLSRDVFKDRYRLGRELGRGPVARVYLAEDLDNDREVAIKVIRPEMSVGYNAERFRREVQMLARLDHPNILSMIEGGEVEGLLYMVTPYVDGESLRQRITRDTHLPVSDALHIALEVAAALEYAHSQGIIHRDIKPDNILLERGRVLVADFGLAKALEAGMSDDTGGGFVVGTPIYMSPEQASGAHLDPRSDIYALGCVLYETIAGEPPFTGPTAQAILARHLVEPAPRLRLLRSGVSDSVEATISKAMEKALEDRYATAAQMMYACAKVLDELASEASRDDYRADPPCKRLRKPLRDRYKIKGQNGEGGMAVVCRADDLKLERDVAIKVLRPELTVSVWADRFLEEIKTTARLTHPHILTLLDSGAAVGLLYYVMPYIEGESVRQRMNSEGPLPIDYAITIGVAVADALQYAHDCGIIHRDIKPDNVLVRGDHVWVADFGIAKSIDAASGTGFTATGHRVGSPEYMSPEHLEGGQALDGRTDLYSLGCLMYTMLAGKPPFTGTDEQVYYKKLTGELPHLHLERPDAPQALEEVLIRALAKKPEDRFESAKAFRQALLTS